MTDSEKRKIKEGWAASKRAKQAAEAERKRKGGK